MFVSSVPLPSSYIVLLAVYRLKCLYVVIVFEVVDIILVLMHSFSVPISRNKTGDSFVHKYDEIKVNKTAHFMFLSATIFCENCYICVSHHRKLFFVYNLANDVNNCFLKW